MRSLRGVQIPQKKFALKDYTKLAHKLILTELKIVDKRVTNPELFVNYSAAATSSPLHWSGKPSQLSELLTALNLSKSITLANGRPAPFTTIVKSFENLLNIKLSDPRDIKRGTLSRTIKKTDFLEHLRALL